MKTLLPKILLITGCMLAPFLTQATIITVSVANFSFTPSTFNAVVGDTVKWVWISGTHTTTSTSVPAGAATWNSPITSSNPTFEYVITVAGTYNYWCAIHTTAMEGSFTASPAGVPAVSSKASVVSVFPNPANTMLNVETQLAKGKVQNICLYNVLGEQVRCLQLTESLTTIGVSDLAQGIYLYRITDMRGNLIKADKVMLVH